MRYLTKEWYELGQNTDLHFDMRVYRGAKRYNDALYSRLYKRKEKEFVESEREMYDLDPRFMLEQDESELVSLDAFVNGEAINDEDIIIHHMSSEEKEDIQKLITEYDNRPPFDDEKCRERFKFIQEIAIKETVNKVPHKLFQQIADVRVFSLGYCTKDIFKQLKTLSVINEKEIDRIFNEYSKVQDEENIPQLIKERFGFHDCELTEYTVGKKDIILRMDTSGGFTNFNEIIFTESEIIKQEGQILGSIWLYEELYRTEDGYEVHILFADEGMPELIIRCKDIHIEEK